MPDKKDLDALVAAITGTSKNLENNKIIYDKINTDQRKMRTLMWVAMVGLVADLTLSLAFGFILNDQSALNARVTANQTSIHTAECDLNTVLIAANTPEQRAKADNPVTYDSWYKTIYATRVRLGCQPPIKNPRP